LRTCLRDLPYLFFFPVARFRYMEAISPSRCTVSPLSSAPLMKTRRSYLCFPAFQVMRGQFPFFIEGLPVFPLSKVPSGIAARPSRNCSSSRIFFKGRTSFRSALLSFFLPRFSKAFIPLCESLIRMRILYSSFGNLHGRSCPVLPRC